MMLHKQKCSNKDQQQNVAKCNFHALFDNVPRQIGQIRCQDTERVDCHFSLSSRQCDIQ